MAARQAIETCLSRSERQRCLAHRMRNLAAKVPKDLWPEFKAPATAAYQAPSRAIARQLADGVVADLETAPPSATTCFRDDFEACIAHLRMPIPHRRAIRTTNLLERLFVEERRRLKIIPNAFGEKPVLKFMFGAMIRAAERWRAIRVTDLTMPRFPRPTRFRGMTVGRRGRAGHGLSVMPSWATIEPGRTRATAPATPSMNWSSWSGS